MTTITPSETTTMYNDDSSDMDEVSIINLSIYIYYGIHYLFSPTWKSMLKILKRKTMLLLVQQHLLLKTDQVRHHHYYVQPILTNRVFRNHTRAKTYMKKVWRGEGGSGTM